MKTILVVDDEFSLVESLAYLLQHEGYRVISAANGKDGFARLQREKPDLVLLDLMMPIANGWQMIRDMRATGEFLDTPVVLMSPAPKNVVISHEVKESLRVTQFLCKPFQVDELIDTIVQLIGRSEPQAVRTP